MSEQSLTFICPPSNLKLKASTQTLVNTKITKEHLLSQLTFVWGTLMIFKVTSASRLGYLEVIK